MNVTANNENDFNQQITLYLSQGYHAESNFNGNAILKKGYSTGLLIILIFLFFPLAIIYYIVSNDDIVSISTNRTL